MNIITAKYLITLYILYFPNNKDDRFNNIKIRRGANSSRGIKYLYIEDVTSQIMKEIIKKRNRKDSRFENLKNCLNLPLIKV